MLKNQKGAMWLGVLLGLVIGLAFAVGVAWYLMKSTPKVFKTEDATARKYDESDRKSSDNNKSSNQASKSTGAVIKPVRRTVAKPVPAKAVRSTFPRSRPKSSDDLDDRVDPVLSKKEIPWRCHLSRRVRRTASARRSNTSSGPPRPTS